MTKQIGKHLNKEQCRYLVKNQQPISSGGVLISVQQCFFHHLNHFGLPSFFCFDCIFEISKSSQRWDVKSAAERRVVHSDMAPNLQAFFHNTVW